MISAVRLLVFCQFFFSYSRCLERGLLNGIIDLYLIADTSRINFYFIKCLVWNFQNLNKHLMRDFFIYFLDESGWTFLDNLFWPIFNKINFSVKFDHGQSRMIQVNWSSKPLCCVHGWISSKTGRKVVQKNYAVLYRPYFPFFFSLIFIAFIVCNFTVCVKRKVYCLLWSM